MPDNNQNSWSNPKPIGTGEGEVPLTNSGAPKIDIRTLATDTKSLQEEGMVSPKPYIPPPSIPTPPVNKIPETTFSPPAPIDMRTPSRPTIPQDLKNSLPKKKTKLLPVIVLVLAVGFAALGYFVIYPSSIDN